MINSTHVLHLVDNSIYIIREERGKGKERRREGEIEYLFFTSQQRIFIRNY